MTHICYTHDKLAPSVQGTSLASLLKFKEINLTIMTACCYELFKSR